jgi:hypothetical protein
MLFFRSYRENYGVVDVYLVVTVNIRVPVPARSVRHCTIRVRQVNGIVYVYGAVAVDVRVGVLVWTAWSRVVDRSWLCVRLFLRAP